MKKSWYFLLWVLVLSSCSRKTGAGISVPVSNTVPDYGKDRYWAALPTINDPSDELPAPLREDYRKDTSVDVFFIHPTTFTGEFQGRWNAAVEDEALNKKTDESTIRFQASAFNEFNVYAPRYRQAQITSFYTSDTLAAGAALEAAYEDVRAAFSYYLQHWNKGRPIIIASHSQGTRHAKQLLRDFFEDSLLRQQLVAAYLIGYPVEPDYFSAIPPCEDSAQTGCFISWRTFRAGYEPPYAPAFRQSVVVNPLSWKTDTSYAPTALHKGAVLRNFNKIYYRVNDARVYKDLLWVSRPRFPGSRLIRTGNYHIGDINLFYQNIRENLRTRVAEFRRQKIGW
ncbi:MAG TPA: DUF3089 domain-containing protein [Flavihumibacter sp.]